VDRSATEAEGILREGCVGHNYLWFYADAIELDLEAGNWEGVKGPAALSNSIRAGFLA
jgi:hypothetical protein